jgi:hypothetical protein
LSHTNLHTITGVGCGGSKAVIGGGTGGSFAIVSGLSSADTKAYTAYDTKAKTYRHMNFFEHECLG